MSGKKTSKRHFALDEYNGSTEYNKPAFLQRLEEFEASEDGAVVRSVLGDFNHKVLVCGDPEIGRWLFYGHNGWELSYYTTSELTVSALADFFAEISGHYPNAEVADVIIAFIDERTASFRQHRQRSRASEILAAVGA
jgi:hypothetical protein